jgi:ABC-2 type transport system ATP-binding protein
MAAIKTFELTKRYQDTLAVDRLNLEIFQGEVFALLGVNGAGKTTVIKMLSLLSRPSSGEGFVCGHSILTEPIEVKKRIGVSPQESAVAPNLSVRENLELVCGIFGFSKEKTKKKIEALSELFSLDLVLGKKAGKLSGGFQRRLSISMALISEPEVLFLDEPTLGLDVLARRELWDVILSLKGKTTVVLTTHYLEEAEALSDRIGILKSGRLLAVGSAEELKEKTGASNFESAFISVVKEEKK